MNPLELANPGWPLSSHGATSGQTQASTPQGPGGSGEIGMASGEKTLGGSAHAVLGQVKCGEWI